MPASYRRFQSEYSRDALYSPDKWFHFLLSICSGAEGDQHCVDAIVIVPSVAAAAITTAGASAIRHYCTINTHYYNHYYEYCLSHFCGSGTNGHLLNVRARQLSILYMRLIMYRR